MTTLMKYSVGVDVSKDTLHACICEIDSQQQVKIKTSHRFLNSKKDYTALMQWFTKHRKQDVPLVICMEATGIYYEKVALELYQKGYSVSVLLPSKAKRYMQSLGLKTKNDKIDASGLAQMGAEQSLALWQPLGDYFYFILFSSGSFGAKQKERLWLIISGFSFIFGIKGTVVFPQCIH